MRFELPWRVNEHFGTNMQSEFAYSLRSGFELAEFRTQTHAPAARAFVSRAVGAQNSPLGTPHQPTHRARCVLACASSASLECCSENDIIMISKWYRRLAQVATATNKVVLVVLASPWVHA